MDRGTIRRRAGLGPVVIETMPEELAQPPVESVVPHTGEDAHSVEDVDELSAFHHAPKSLRKHKLHDLKVKAKAKTKSVLHIHDAEPIVPDANYMDTALVDIKEDPAFHPSRVVEQADEQNKAPGSVGEKSLHNLRSIGHAIAHPREAAQSKATRTTASELSWMQRPQISEKTDLEFLEAHDALLESQAGEIPNRDDHNTSTEEYRKNLAQVEEHRESILVAWTTRHIKRVATVQKLQIDKWPDREAFTERDPKGNFVRYRWEKWLGYIVVFYTQNFSAQYIDDFDELPFDIDQLRDHVERIIMASAPWQKWAMDVRAVYRWDDPRKTGGWLAFYLVLWHFQFMMGFLWSYILYLVIRNRYFPTSVKALRESNRRAKDLEGTAYQLGELVEKHGRENWVEPLIEELGPFIQLQLGDVANLLEVFANFYAWKHPRKTLSSLCFFAACFLICAFTDMRFCMKVFWFAVGMAFFTTLPISSRYPKYRLLVSPFKWILWEIPTNAEWSLSYLRRQAQFSREKMIVHKVDDRLSAESRDPVLSSYTGHLDTHLDSSASVDGNGDDDDDDTIDTASFHSATSATSILSQSSILTFRVTHNSRPGNLTIHSSSLRFLPDKGRHISHPSTTTSSSWTISFLDLAELRKIDGTASKLQKLTNSTPLSKLSKASGATGQQLEILTRTGDVRTFHMDDDRDEAFNAIIGFSGLRWQVLQSGPGKNGNGKESGNGNGKGGKNLFGDVGLLGIA
ncbi:hypothetical protein MMC19_001547 [Ptychographa xylographoides]|nr:hypothetical protein [Ptychographa xylographoides]